MQFQHAKPATIKRADIKFQPQEVYSITILKETICAVMHRILDKAFRMCPQHALYALSAVQHHHAHVYGHGCHGRLSVLL